MLEMWDGDTASNRRRTLLLARQDFTQMIMDTSSPSPRHAEAARTKSAITSSLRVALNSGITACVRTKSQTRTVGVLAVDSRSFLIEPAAADDV